MLDAYSQLLLISLNFSASEIRCPGLAKLI